jgi:7TM sweet-taste receptor of 3 GCPR
MGVSTPHADTVVVDEHRPGLNYEECSFSWGSDGVFVILLLAYRALLIAYSVVLALQLRKVTYTLFNESKAILFAMYNLFFFLVLIIIILAVGIDREAEFIARTILVITAVSLSLLAIYVPKFLMIRQGLQMDAGSFRDTAKVSAAAQQLSQFSNLSSSVATADAPTQARISELETLLEQSRAEVDRLRAQLQQASN